MTKNKCQVNELYGKQVFNIVVAKQPTRIDNLEQSILHAIKNNLPVVLEVLLKDKFIYTVNGGMCEWLFVIDALLHDHTSVFLKAIQSILMQPENEKLINVMIKALEFTDISPEKLYVWNENMRQSLDHDRNDMNEYVAVLKKEEDELARQKVDSLTELSIQLSQLIHQAEKLNVTLAGTNKDKLQVLCYKLQMRAVMDVAYPMLALHRGYRRLNTNILLGIPLLIPQTVNYFFTENFWFANKTASQQLVDAAAKNTGLDMPLHFAPALAVK